MKAARRAVARQDAVAFGVEGEIGLDGDALGGGGFKGPVSHAVGHCVLLVVSWRAEGGERGGPAETPPNFPRARFLRIERFPSLFKTRPRARAGPRAGFRPASRCFRCLATATWRVSTARGSRRRRGSWARGSRRTTGAC
ncbi:hypothetical protein SDC9_204638 [bioreactor metagenome]|uniref:Uncharacterized protein n=1 Tax=bioreactor metagenome TaxID=1076179 RepID=A0A645IZR7_9ZZZZ